MEHQFLHLVIALKKPKCVLTPMSILCILDFYAPCQSMAGSKPGAVFTHNTSFSTGPISQCYITLTLESLARDTHSSLVATYVSYEENEVM